MKFLHCSSSSQTPEGFRVSTSFCVSRHSVSSGPAELMGEVMPQCFRRWLCLSGSPSSKDSEAALGVATEGKGRRGCAHSRPTSSTVSTLVAFSTAQLSSLSSCGAQTRAQQLFGTLVGLLLNSRSSFPPYYQSKVW